MNIKQNLGPSETKQNYKKFFKSSRDRFKRPPWFPIAPKGSQGVPRVEKMITISAADSYFDLHFGNLGATVDFFRISKTTFFPL